MYTVVKNQVAEVPTSHGSFLNEKQLAKAPRFDQILTSLKETQRKQNASQSRIDTKARDARVKSYFVQVDNKIGQKHRDMTPNKYCTIRYVGPPMINTSDYKQQFLKGEKNALYYCDPNAPKSSSY